LRGMPSRKTKNHRSSFPLFVIEEPPSFSSSFDIDNIPHEKVVSLDILENSRGKRSQHIVKYNHARFLTLPEELICKIFSYFVLPDLVAMILTCSEFRRIGNDSRLLYGCYMDVFSSPVFLNKEEDFGSRKVPPAIPKKIVLESWRLLCSITKTLLETAIASTVRNQSVEIFEKMIRFHPQTFNSYPLSTQHLNRLLELNPPFANILQILPEKEFMKLIEFWSITPAKKNSKRAFFVLNFLKSKRNFVGKQPNFARFIFKCVKSGENPGTIAKLLKILREKNLLKNFSNEIWANLQSLLICSNSKNCMNLLKFIGALK